MQGQILRFFKYQGTGNDFIVIDQLEKTFPISPKQIQQLCDRHFGVGADGALVLSKDDTANFNLVFYNPDGSESFCGNGSRCAVRYFLKKENKSDCTFTGFDGLHSARLIDENTVTIDLNVSQSVAKNQHGFVINTGAPHVCVPTEGLKNMAIAESAKEIRWHEAYQPVGTNVNFFEKLAENQVAIRTFEKGVEGETLSCGTGVTAVAISVFSQDSALEEVEVQSQGGVLRVAKDKNPNKYWLTGAANEVFEGEIPLA